MINNSASEPKQLTPLHLLILISAHVEPTPKLFDPRNSTSEEYVWDLIRLGLIYRDSAERIHTTTVGIKKLEQLLKILGDS